MADEGNENEGAGNENDDAGNEAANARSAAGSNSDGTGTGSKPEGTDPATGEPKGDDPVEKWRSLSRKNEKDLRETQRKLKEYEDKGKTETQRLEEARDSFKTAAEKASSELKYMNVAIEHAPAHATLAQLRKVAKRLRGDSDEDLETDAKELWDDFAPAPKESSDSGASKPGSVAGKPKERLKGGADPGDAPDEMNPAKIAAGIPRAR